MQERLRVSWTQKKSIKDNNKRSNMLSCKRRLISSKVLADPPPLFVSFPNCKDQHNVQLYSGSLLNIKLYAPVTIDTSPQIQNQPLTKTNYQRPAMHRKSKSKCKLTVFNNISPLLSLSERKNQPSTEHSSETAVTVQKHEETSAGIEVKTSQYLPSITNSKKGCHYHKRIKSKNGSLSSSLLSSKRCKMAIPFPTLGATSFLTLLTLICIETILLSTMSSCAKTFYMHWNTSNSIFRIDNTDHIIDVNKGNLAFEFDQVHIICPVYEPGTFENETEKYIIYNVSKVEYETCRITNADPRVIAICDKPQKLMFFTITFRPFTPQPGGLEFLPGNDYYFISTSSKDDLYRRIGGRCSTNNMKVVFKVCCAAEGKNKTTASSKSISGAETGVAISVNIAANDDSHVHGQGLKNIGLNGGLTSGVSQSAGMPLNPINGNINLNGIETTINSNIDQFNRIPIQPNIIGNNVGNNVGGSAIVGGGIMLTPGHGHGINMLQPGRGGVNVAYPGHHHIQTGIRINNVPTQHSYTPHKDDHHNYDKHPNEVVKNEELTYNSGTASTDRHILTTWKWFLTFIPMPSFQSCCLSAYWINSYLVLSIFSILGFHYLVENVLQTTIPWYGSIMIECSPTSLFVSTSNTVIIDR
ncbi:uncharacterized protein LOC108102310 isoform X2 [Drosophila eugracilis]|uniref:uncharacterized protein LOC108102310 isoform X2 n=1 Tax=Drosophila eugracilis TaxID=29029 RepID=UPI0007E79014|nr:uncharacterized protein LOC108102310 isoform X2 [Drosophila eugracilis]